MKLPDWLEAHPAPPVPNCRHCNRRIFTKPWGLLDPLLSQRPPVFWAMKPLHRRCALRLHREAQRPTQAAFDRLLAQLGGST